MKQKNLPDDIESKSLDELKEILNNLVEKIEKNLKRKLSKAGVETLAIIAYYQPVTKGEIEKVRARNISQGTLDILLKRGWIELKGRRKTPGRPLTWGTTDKFLEHFNLTDLKELPTLKEINQLGIEEKRG